MAKKKNKSKGAKNAPKKEAERVTLEAIDAMSDSDEDIPENQMNDKAKNLRNAIKDGKFDSLIETLKKSKQDDDDVDDFEEASLGSSDDEQQPGGDDENDEDGEGSAAEESSSEADDDAQEGGDQDDDDEEDEGDDAQQEDDESEEKDADGSSETDEEDSDDDRENVRSGKMKLMDSNNQNNFKALSVVTADLVKAHAELPWGETFDVVPPTPLPFGDVSDGEPVDIHDDLKREVAFYNSALESVHEARRRCKKGGIPFRRPDDFFAEMVKTDDHMAKVKDKLIFENKKMEAVAQRKSNKEQKLRAKESQSNRVAEKAKRKRDHFEQVQEWANNAAKNRGGALQDGADEKYLKGSNKKRQIADRKFGFGGKKGRFKQNTRDSLNDTSGFNPRGNFPGAGTKKSAKSNNAGAGRPGKRARDSKRSRRS